MVNFQKRIAFKLLLSYWFLKYFELLDLYLCVVAIVAVFIITVIIMPSSDIFTLMLVALPILLLYEISIYVVKDKSYH